MTEQDTGRETRLLEIKGRHVVVRALKDTQILLLAREAQILTRKDVDKNRIMQGVTRLMDILESAIVQDMDRDYVTDLTIRGELELSDLMGVLTAFRDVQTAAEPKPAVRRGRPRKTAV